MNEAALSVRGLNYTYGTAERELAVLRGIDFTVRAGELFCVLGPSGCGKTTLLKLIAGFLPVQEGRITACGRPVSSPGPKRALVFQQPRLFPWRTVAGNIEYALHNRYPERRLRREKLEQLLNLIGLADFASAYPVTLSGGMRQRVALARALALEPEILLLDEPFAALDQFTREHLQDELLRLKQETGCAMLLVTHNLQEAAYLGERIMVLSRRPGRMTHCLKVDLPRPRRRSDQRLWEIERQLYLHCGCCRETPDLHLVNCRI